MGKILAVENYLGELYWILNQSYVLSCIRWVKSGL